MHRLKQQLKKLISVTPHLYQTLYLTLLNNLERVLKNQDLFLSVFAHAIDTLKVRRGFMLPIGADAETCYREQEVWTYAIFTAVLLKEAKLTFKSKENVKFKNFEQLLPKSGLAWLQGYPSLFEHWSNYLSDNINQTNFIWHVTKKLKQPSAANDAIHEIIEAEVEIKTANKTISSNEDIATNTSESIVTQNIADQFINWLTKNIQMNALSFNQIDSCLHRVSEGLFILMPETLMLFIENTLSYKQIFKELDNTKTRRKYIRSLSQALMLTNLFIPSVSADNLLKGWLIKNDTSPEIAKILSDLSISISTNCQIASLVTDVR